MTVTGTAPAPGPATVRPAGGRTEPARVLVVREAGWHTAVQDPFGRSGYWHVGVPPSGAMDDLSLRLANRAVGNVPGAAGLECTAVGPVVEAGRDAVVCVAGAPADVRVDGAPAPMWTPLCLRAGQTLRVGRIGPVGMRTYVAVRGGIDVPVVLGSRSTFVAGALGGLDGRTLAAGDVLPVGRDHDPSLVPSAVPSAARPSLGHRWRVHVLVGPHAGPEFLAPEWLETLFGTWYEVDTASSRSGLRLRGPRPHWTRPHGGEAGLHPSNIHDTGYAIGALNLTGDVPVLLGPDGPSCGGFVCPAVVAAAERWKLGQIAPGDRVRLVPVVAEQAAALDARARHVTSLLRAPRRSGGVTPRRDPAAGRLWEREAGGGVPAVVHRRAGDRFLLVEYGPMVLDLELRARVHALAQWVEGRRIPGVVSLTPGVRSLLVEIDGTGPDVDALGALLATAEDELPPARDLVVPSRTVHLPLAFDDPSVREAMERYQRSVRPDAPWCPSNVEFIRRVNGLDSVDDVAEIVFAASYVVLGLGDVYLGAPVATPLDPRHRLVTTKYNPARTWTPANAVGIGGAYLCIYGMEGPGGYQLVGRTVPIWTLAEGTRGFEPGVPWLLRCFDRIRFHPVTPERLEELRAALHSGAWGPRIEPGTLSIEEHLRFLEANSASIAAFRERQRAAFEAERARWAAAGEVQGAGA
ncbi:MAG: hypothetical protein KatS3mg009_3182 [Acidimicrobiia bacterium]|nr:MAG: hypothetical protein KatS3mg009_3182 [Acidimicrobiia bacterium]